MPTLEERVSYLEGQMAEQTHIFAAIRDSIAALDRRIDRLEHRMDVRFDGLDRRFLWIVGIQITTLVAVMGALLSRA